MNKKRKALKLLALALLIFFSILITLLSLELVAISQNASSIREYAYVVEDGNNISVISTTTNSITNTIDRANVGGGICGVSVSPDGKVYMTNDVNNTVSVIDAATHHFIATVTVGDSPIGVAVTPDGKKVYVTNFGDDTVSVIDTSTNKVTATVEVGQSPFGVAVSSDGSKVYVTNTEDNTTSIIDTMNNKVTATVPVGMFPTGVAVNPNGKEIYVANSAYIENSTYNSNVSVIDTATNTVTSTVPVGDSPAGVAVTPDGKKVYVTNYYSNTVSVIDATKKIVTNIVNVGKGPIGIAVCQDGKKVYVENTESDNISVIEASTNKVISTVDAGNNSITFGQFVVTVPWYNWFSNLVQWFIGFAILFGIFSSSFEDVASIFNKLVRKKSFEQISVDLKSKNTLKEQVSIMKSINSYLQKYTFEEFLFFNLNYDGIEYFPTYHYSFFRLLLVFFLSIFVTIDYTIGYVPSTLLLFLAPIVITLFPIFVFGVIDRKIRVKKTPWKKFVRRLLINMTEPVFIMFILLLIFIAVVILISEILDLITKLNDDAFIQGLITYLMHIDFINYSISLFARFSEFKLNSVESNQLSLAGFYFSLAVSGTVVLSIIDRYFKEEDSLNDDLLKQVEKFNSSSYKCNSPLSLDLSYITCYKRKSINFGRLNIQKRISLLIKYIHVLEKKWLNVRSDLKCVEIIEKSTKTNKFELFILSIIFTYIIGIALIFMPERFVTIFLWLFIVDSFYFGILIYFIYIDFGK